MHHTSQHNAAASTWLPVLTFWLELSALPLNGIIHLHPNPFTLHRRQNQRRGLGVSISSRIVKEDVEGQKEQS
jgi:hypothetical protein